MSAIVNNTSEYIRLNHNNKQDVTTNLNFKNTVTCKEATNQNEVVNLGQIGNISNDIIQELKDTLQIPIKTVDKLEIRINGYNNRNQSTGAVINSLNGYNGFGGMVFMDNRHYPLQVVGFSWGANYNNITVYNNFMAYIMGVKKVYFALQPNHNFIAWVTNKAGVANNIRMCKEPLSDEDKEYLTNIGTDIICISTEYENNFLFNSGQSFYDWESPLTTFKSYCFSNPPGTQINCGSLWAYNNNSAVCYQTMWIENDDFNSLDNFLSNVIGFSLGSCSSGASNYGSGMLGVTLCKNNYKEIDDVRFNITGRMYAFINISENEANNDAVWDPDMLATYPSATNVGILNLGFAAGRIKYNATTKEYYWEATTQS